MHILKEAWDDIEERGRIWKKWLSSLTVTGLRGWNGHRITFDFPITALVGENGSGKSTFLQAAAACYQSPDNIRKTWFASDFFPSTTWDRIEDAKIEFSVKDQEIEIEGSIRKPTNRWRGNPDRPKRHVYYIDLSRITPFSARSGYNRLLNSTLTEGTLRSLGGADMTTNMSGIMGTSYDRASLATASNEPAKPVPVLQKGGTTYSGFHQGAGELAIAELLSHNIEAFSLVIIDEIETALHPRAQRRLMDFIAEISRKRKLQFIISTHSPYILEKIPKEGRICIFDNNGEKTTISNISAEFAMSKIDSINYHELRVLVEDEKAKTLIKSIISIKRKDLVTRIEFSTFGSADNGKKLGEMLQNGQSPHLFGIPTIIYLDGDQKPSNGVGILPGNTNPERDVFTRLKEKEWPGVAARLDREHPSVKHTLETAMTNPKHHNWVYESAKRLSVEEETLWTTLCAAWTRHCATDEEIDTIIRPVEETFKSPPT